MSKVTVIAVVLCMLSSSVYAAQVFNPVYKPSKGVLVLKSGVGMRTGSNSSGSSETNPMGSYWVMDDVNFLYGYSSKLTLTARVQANGATPSYYNDGDPQIGFSYYMYGNNTFKLDLAGKAGLGLTNDKRGGDTRRERLDMEGSAKFYGGMNAFSWAATVGLYFALPHNDDAADVESRIDGIIILDGMYQFSPKWAGKLTYDHRMYGEQEVSSIKHKGFSDITLTFAGVYTATQSVSLMPYLSYHLEDKDSAAEIGKDYFQVGVQMGINF